MRTGSLRRWLLLASAVLVPLLVVRAQAHSPELPRLPAEFEPHDSVWMAWPTFQYTAERSSVPVVTEMIRALVPHVRIDLLVNSDEIGTQALAHLRSEGVSTRRVDVHVVPYIDIWLRDMGPIFLVAPDGT